MFWRINRVLVSFDLLIFVTGFDDQRSDLVESVGALRRRSLFVVERQSDTVASLERTLHKQWVK
jgi:hypothetical protein